jgi:hypothetical protein
VLAGAAVGLACVLLVGVARTGAAVVLGARADAAADASALAAADALASGRGPAQALTAARETARLNGAALVECRCVGMDASVTVRVVGRGDLDGGMVATGRARAVVDLGGLAA